MSSNNGTFQLPTPKNLYDLVDEKLTQSITDPTELAVAKATANQIINGEPININGLYNFFLFAGPSIRDFLTGVNVSNFTNDTLKQYGLIWVPFQYVIIAIFVVFIIVFAMIAGSLEFNIGIWLILLSIGVLGVLAIIQLQLFEDFLVDRKNTFETSVKVNFDKFVGTALLDGALGYISGGQLTFNNGVIPSETGTAQGLGGTGTIVLTNQGSENKPNLLDPPYFKLSLISTVTGPTGPTGAVFHVQLNEPSVVPPNPLVYPFVPKPQYAKVVYIGNSNPMFSNGPNPGDYDQGVIKILNASPMISQCIPAGLASQYGPDVVLPPKVYQGVFLYPGELKCFVNVGPNFNFYTSGGSGTGPTIPLAPTMWTEVTSDIRPFSTTTKTNPIRALNKIIYMQFSGSPTVTVDTSLAIPGQELYLVSQPPDGGTITVSSDDGTVFTPLTFGKIIYLQFAPGGSNIWFKIFP